MLSSKKEMVVHTPAEGYSPDETGQETPVKKLNLDSAIKSSGQKMKKLPLRKDTPGKSM